jgi:hypothetical protein
MSLKSRTRAYTIYIFYFCNLSCCVTSSYKLWRSIFKLCFRLERTQLTKCLTLIAITTVQSFIAPALYVFELNCKKLDFQKVLEKAGCGCQICFKFFFEKKNRAFTVLGFFFSFLCSHVPFPPLFLKRLFYFFYLSQKISKFV